MMCLSARDRVETGVRITSVVQHGFSAYLPSIPYKRTMPSTDPIARDFPSGDSVLNGIGANRLTPLYETVSKAYVPVLDATNNHLPSDEYVGSLEDAMPMLTDFKTSWPALAGEMTWGSGVGIGSGVEVAGAVSVGELVVGDGDAWQDTRKRKMAVSPATLAREE
jgi:hypothetical protein